MNDAVNAALLSENESPLLYNACLDEKGTLGPRTGCEKRYSVDIGTAEVVGMGSFYKSDGTSRLLIATDDGKLYVDTPHVISKYSTQAEFNAGELHNLYAHSDGKIIPYIFRDDFEGGTFAKWTTADTGWSIVTDVLIAGTKTAKGTGIDKDLVYALDRNVSDVYLKCKVRFPATNTRNSIIATSSTGTTVQLFVAKEDASFEYNDLTFKDFEVPTTYVINTNYTVEIIVSGGKYWVYVGGACISPSGINLKDTAGNAITQIKDIRFETGVPSTSSGTMYLDDVEINPLTPVFTRTSTKYKKDGTKVAAGVPTYESGGYHTEEAMTTLVTNGFFDSLLC